MKVKITLEVQAEVNIEEEFEQFRRSSPEQFEHFKTCVLLWIALAPQRRDALYSYASRLILEQADSLEPLTPYGEQLRQETHLRLAGGAWPGPGVTA